MVFGYSRAVLCCAGAFVSGAAGSNACPAGSVRIEAEDACRTAAAFAGKYVGSPFVVTYSISPRGCYYDSSNVAYFNTHAVGAGFSTQLLCAALAVTTGAPPPHRASVRTRVSCAVRRAWARARKGTARVCNNIRAHLLNGPKEARSTAVPWVPRGAVRVG
jgi:hypothetical protein